MAAKRRDYMHSNCARAIRLSMQDTTAVSRQEFVELKAQQDNEELEENDDNQELFKSQKLFNDMAS